MNFLKQLLLPFYVQYSQFQKVKLQASYLDFLIFKLGGQKLYWPKSRRCTVANSRKIYVGKNALIGRPGCYIQGAGGVYIGDYVQFGPNVGVLSSNHDLYDQRLYKTSFVSIGDYSWVGMNSVILPGVILGKRTIVAAGSVVTKSFPDGFCVLGGVPARIIKNLEEDKFTSWKNEKEYFGFLDPKEFQKNKFKYLDIDLIHKVEKF